MSSRLFWKLSLARRPGCKNDTQLRLINRTFVDDIYIVIKLIATGIRLGQTCQKCPENQKGWKNSQNHQLTWAHYFLCSADKGSLTAIPSVYYNCYFDHIRWFFAAARIIYFHKTELKPLNYSGLEISIYGQKLCWWMVPWFCPIPN